MVNIFKKAILILLCILALNYNITYANEINSKSNIKIKDNPIKNFINSIINNFDPQDIEEEEKVYNSRTLEEMKVHDYYAESITGISKEKIDDSILKKNLKKYGNLIYKGMPIEEYKQITYIQLVVKG